MDRGSSIWGARRPMAAPPSFRQSLRSLCLVEGPSEGPREGKEAKPSPHPASRDPGLGGALRALQWSKRCHRGLDTSHGACSPGGGVTCSHCSCRLLADLLGDRPVLGLEPLRQDRPCPPPAASPHPSPAGAASTLHGGIDQGSRALAPFSVPALLPAGGQSSPAGVTGPQVTTGGTEAARWALSLISGAGLLDASQQSPWVPGSNRTELLWGK